MEYTVTVPFRSSFFSVMCLPQVGVNILRDLLSASCVVLITVSSNRRNSLPRNYPVLTNFYFSLVFSHNIEEESSRIYYKEITFD